MNVSSDARQESMTATRSLDQRRDGTSLQRCVGAVDTLRHTLLREARRCFLLGRSRPAAMGGMVSCGRGAQVAPNQTPEFAEEAGAAVNKGSSAINSLTEAQLEEFRAAFNSFDEECVPSARRSPPP